MFKHEHFREICAAAGVGQATPEELLELERHASVCESCCQAYLEYLNIASRQFAETQKSTELSSRAAQECLDSELFERRFFERAEREGIVFSEDVGEEVRKMSPQMSNRLAFLWGRAPAWAVAAAVLLSVTVPAAYFYERSSFLRIPQGTQVQANALPVPQVPVNTIDSRVAEITDANVKLQGEINRLSAALRNASDRVNAAQTHLESASQDRQKLISDRDALAAQLTQVQQQLAESQVIAENAEQETAKLRDHAGDLDATLVADQVKIQDLTEDLKEKSASLDQEHQLLTYGHDVTDLMGARNLHIVDVVDTDPHGKTQHAFGRVFFTEGKSLIFYAYDLNEAKSQKTNLQYRIWAKREGADKDVKNLGIFYSDDMAQRRWVFKCSDPKILSEIDSVFVTLEPANGDPSHPNGPNLMYAYLRGQPNHP